jgi:hypothetical protein
MAYTQVANEERHLRVGGVRVRFLIKAPRETEKWCFELGELVKWLREIIT